MSYILIALAGLFLGSLLAAYLKRDNKGWQVFAKAVQIIAFYRCFGKWSEGSVLHVLRNRKVHLENQFSCRDSTREYLSKDPDSAFWKNALADTENWIIDAQAALDYALGLAFLAGFGKLAVKVLNEKQPTA